MLIYCLLLIDPLCILRQRSRVGFLAVLETCQSAYLTNSICFKTVLLTVTSFEEMMNLDLLVTRHFEQIQCKLYSYFHFFELSKRIICKEDEILQFLNLFSNHHRQLPLQPLVLSNLDQCRIH